MQITFQGREYDFDFDAIDVNQATVIKNHTGMAMVPWRNAISQGDPQALQALVWSMKQQNGEKASVGNANFRPSELLDALGEALMADSLGEPAATDPTKSNGAPTQAKSAATTD